MSTDEPKGAGRPEDGRRPARRKPRPGESAGEARPPRTNDRPPRADRGDRPQRPYAPRADRGDRPQRPYAPRADRGDSPQRPYAPRADRGDRPQRPYAPRADRGDRPQRPYTPRAEGGGRAQRPYAPRADRGDRPQRPYAPRAEGGDRPQRPYAPRGDRPQRPFDRDRPRADRPQRTFDRSDRPRADRPQRPYDRGDRPQRPYAPRGDRPQRTFDRDRPRTFDRTDRPRTDRPQRPYGPRGDRPQGGPRPQGPREHGVGRGYIPGVTQPPRGGFGRRDAGNAAERREPPLPSNPREAALQILFAVDTRSAFSDRLLDAAHGRGSMPPADRALMHELVKGTLRWRGRVDWALEQRVHIGFGQLPPWIRNVLRLGAYQLLFLDRIPAHSAVDESVKLANHYGHAGTAGLVNSVLRRIADEKDAIAWPDGDDAASLAVWGSHPEWIVARWLERFGPGATRALLLANDKPSRLGLRANVLRATRDQLIAALAAADVTGEPGALAPEMVWVDGNVSPLALAAFRDGLCTAQDESECLVARLLGPEQHDRVLDLCAAPGGKTTHIAEMIGDDGDVWALEPQPARITSIEQNIERLGLHSIHTVEGDGRSYDFPMPFDRVLVDAPCSGLGVLGRRADARWRKSPEILEEMPPIQVDLLLAAAERARPGGVIVYSVCSFEPEETVDVVEAFLRRAPNVRLEPATGILPAEVVDERGFMCVLPHVHGCDGAFAARFRRT